MERAFSLADQAAFAVLSGDFNPMHVDPQAARRLQFGRPVVHGVHAVLAALDAWLGGRLGGQPQPVRLARITAAFRAVICVDDAIAATARAEGPGRTAITLAVRGRRTAAITFDWAPATPEDALTTLAPGLPPASEEALCRDPAEATLGTAAGRLPLRLDPTRLPALLPRVARLLPHWQAVTLMATSRLVGMEAPGLNSVYARMAFDFGPAPAALDHLDWRARDYDPRFRFLRLDIAAAGTRGEIDALVRAKPVPQPSMADLAGLIPQRAFAGRRVLVVGGSRGAGEVAAKLYAKGGGAVWITYAAGVQDAARVAAEIRADGAEAQASALNVLDIDGDVCNALRAWRPTDVAYFATPRIEPTKNRTFSGEMFAGLCRFYVAGFAEVFGSVITAELVRVFYPSTIFLDERPARFAEYIAAKAAGESLCASLMQLYPRVTVHAPRLPRMATDQTSAEAEAAAPILARFLLTEDVPATAAGVTP